jgi:hypothetical protein
MAHWQDALRRSRQRRSGTATLSAHDAEAYPLLTRMRRSWWKLEHVWLNPDHSLRRRSSWRIRLA